MDAQTLSEAMGGTLSLDRYRQLLPAFEESMRVANINTPLRAAHYCAQLGHESVGLKYQSEIWGPTAAQRTYDGRMGNRRGTDDWSRFRGHGWIQVTGRDNHTACSRWAHAQGLVPTADFFVTSPEKLGNDQYVGIGPAWYWTAARPNLNSLCDADDLSAVTIAINGGTNGIADRRARLARCKGLGNRLLPSAAKGGTPVATVEKRLDYSRAEIAQDTYYWCGPATTQTLIQARTGNMVAESVLAKELGTTINGTNGVQQLQRVLNARIGGNWKVGAMPNDPPNADQKKLLWDRIVGSINGRVGVAANIWVPPGNYPRPSYKSDQKLQYSGGFIKHYLCVMGYAIDSAGVKHVWLADSGFAPYGSWITFDQFATLIPPREYAYASDWMASTEATPSKPKETTVSVNYPKLALEQLAGSGEKNGAPTFTGWGIEDLITKGRENLQKYGSATLPQMLAIAHADTFRAIINEGKK
ncbi:glycoside hydrolase family 19 protein [Corynebacterium glyciniphilum]|uniref:glycoside hydrolase family 19 protein n=1 Tax=Corynebacterium glyciniphilum TaxID=1404244 RepID=UPI003FCF7E43